MINFFKNILSWIYINNCYFCRKPSQTGSMCKNCYDKIIVNNPEPLKIINNIAVYSASLYAEELKKLIRGLKYHNQKELAKPFAEILYEFWQKTEFNKDEFELIPTPLYIKREKQRGYNHMTLVAEEFSRLSGYSINKDLVERIKNTKPQYKLSRNERIENMRGAFKVNPEKYKGKKLLLMDDICTSGTTLKELITELQKQNIKDLYVIVGSTPLS